MGTDIQRFGAVLDCGMLRFGATLLVTQRPSLVRMTRIDGLPTPPAVPPPLGETAADRRERRSDTVDACRRTGGGAGVVELPSGAAAAAASTTAPRTLQTRGAGT